jgi:hypothetical protein
MSFCTGGDGNNLLTQGFVGPAIPAGRRSCCIYDGWAILVGHQGRGALIQEGPPLAFLASVLPVCVW